MKIFVISDNEDTCIGLRMTGVEGVVVQDKDGLKKAIDACVGNPEIAILLITEKLAKLMPEYIDEIKLSIKLPLLVEVPDRHGSAKPVDYITNYVRDAIGVKLS